LGELAFSGPREDVPVGPPLGRRSEAPDGR